MSTLSRVAVLLAPLLFSFSAAASPEKLIKDPVNDFAGVIEPAREKDLGDALRALRDRTGVQMAVLLMSSLSGEPIDDFSERVFKSWGGGAKDRNDGVLLVLAVDDRQNRLEIGYGLEPVITDSEAVTILDTQIPALREGRYGDAVAGIIDSVSVRLGELTPGAVIPPRPSFFYQRTAVSAIITLAAWIAAFLAFRWLHRHRSSRRFQAARRNLHIAFWGLAPLALVLITLPSGLPFGFALAIGWLIFAGIGLVHEIADRGRPWRRIVTGILSALYLVAMCRKVIVFGGEAYGTGGELFDAVFPLGILFGLAMLFGTFEPADLSKKKRRGRGSSYDTPYSSESHSTSSSNDSSSWDGGGGSSGGGGASSNW